MQQRAGAAQSKSCWMPLPRKLRKWTRCMLCLRATCLGKGGIDVWMSKGRMSFFRIWKIQRNFRRKRRRILFLFWMRRQAMITRPSKSTPQRAQMNKKIKVGRTLQKLVWNMINLRTRSGSKLLTIACITGWASKISRISTILTTTRLAASSRWSRRERARISSTCKCIVTLTIH